MNIVKQKLEFLNSTLNCVPKQVKKLYVFGFAVLAFREIASLRSNSRLSNANWNTAKSKAYRITINDRMPKIFPKLIKKLNVVREKDIIAVDFSDFNGMQVLMFVKQTKKGRPVPVYFEILTYPIEKDSQNTFVINVIENFVKIIGWRPKLVFDRGFACPSIIQHLSDKKHKYIIRVKKGKGVINLETGELIKAKDSKKTDFKIRAYERNLRMVISDKLENMEEPWYLLTNDFDSKREKIIDEYYHRFEIEEFFRDAKRLLGLEYVNFKKKKSLAVILWFVVLGIWFLWTLKETSFDKVRRNKMRLSRVRYFLEVMKAEIFAAYEATILAQISI
jgi:hypothetical protein